MAERYLRYLTRDADAGKIPVDSDGVFTGTFPAKLSDLRNDLYGLNVEKFITLNKSDFVPEYGEYDGEGNPIEESLAYCYTGTPALKWFTAADKIGVCLTMTNPETGESVKFGYNVPDDYCKEVMSMDFELDHADDGSEVQCLIGDYIAIDIASGTDFLWETSSDSFYVTIYDTTLYESLDEIVIYKAEDNKIPEDCLPTRMCVFRSEDALYTEKDGTTLLIVNKTLFDQIVSGKYEFPNLVLSSPINESATVYHCSGFSIFANNEEAPMVTFEYINIGNVSAGISGYVYLFPTEEAATNYKNR